MSNTDSNLETVYHFTIAPSAYSSGTSERCSMGIYALASRRFGTDAGTDTMSTHTQSMSAGELYRSGLLHAQEL